LRRKLKRGKGDKKKREEELVKAVIEEAVKTEFLEEITEGDMRTDSIAMEEEAVEKKVKITTKYYVVVRSIIQYEDATTEDKTWKYEVKNVKSRADESARLDEEKYQWELITAKGKLIYMYLNGDNTVSTMEIEDEKYLMRGFLKLPKPSVCWLQPTRKQFITNR
jgi:hypothetical protein